MGPKSVRAIGLSHLVDGSKAARLAISVCGGGLGGPRVTSADGLIFVISRGMPSSDPGATTSRGGVQSFTGRRGVSF